jgi:hypothetical protein
MARSALATLDRGFGPEIEGFAKARARFAMLAKPI